MSTRSSRVKYGTFFLVGLGIALIIAAVISPFASSSPDGLERVAEDLGFIDTAHPEPLAQKLPFASVFDGYAFKGGPALVATPIAGIVGALATFGVAWGAGKLLIRPAHSASVEAAEADRRD